MTVWTYVIGIVLAIVAVWLIPAPASWLIAGIIIVVLALFLLEGSRRRGPPV